MAFVMLIDSPRKNRNENVLYLVPCGISETLPSPGLPPICSPGRYHSSTRVPPPSRTVLVTVGNSKTFCLTPPKLRMHHPKSIKERLQGSAGHVQIPVGQPYPIDSKHLRVMFDNSCLLSLDRGLLHVFCHFLKVFKTVSRLLKPFKTYTCHCPLIRRTPQILISRSPAFVRHSGRTRSISSHAPILLMSGPWLSRKLCPASGLLCLPAIRTKTAAATQERNGFGLRNPWRLKVE